MAATSSANTEWEDIPTYSDLVQVIKSVVKRHHDEVVFAGQTAKSTFEWDSWNISSSDVFWLISATILCASIRYIATEWVFKPIGLRCSLSPANQAKMPESAWRFLYFLCIWCYTFYVIILSGKYRLFQKPSTVWEGWNIKENPPSDIYLLYVVQCAFYIDFSYTTLFVDTKRKDMLVMIIHHVATIILVILSHCLRYHKIGCLVFLLHDISDVFMEFAKLNIYFKKQGKKLIKRHEIMGTISFVCFVLAWFQARLYWFPFKVIYAAAQYAATMKTVHMCHFLTNYFLWTLLVLHAYWSMLILTLLYQIVTGQLKELEDTRELDNSEKVSNDLISDKYQKRTEDKSDRYKDSTALTKQKEKKKI